MSKMGRSKILGSVGWDAFNPFPSKLGKTSHFAILLCLMPGYFTLSNTRLQYFTCQGRASGIHLCVIVFYLSFVSSFSFLLITTGSSGV